MSSEDFASKAWLKEHFTRIFESASSTDEATLKAACESTFSSTAQIISNHRAVPYENLVETIRNRTFSATRASLEWKEAFEVPAAGHSDPGAAIVAGCFVVTRSLKFRIRVGPAQTTTTYVFSAKIAHDPNAQGEDKRRIVHLFFTTLDESVPINLGNVPANSS